MPIEAILSYSPPSASDLPIILQLDGDAVLQSEAGDLLLREGELRLRQGHSMRLDVIVTGRVADEAAPAAADVEKALALLQAQLAADHVELGDLGLLQTRDLARKIGAGIDHLGIEPECVKCVRDVVVIGDVLLVPARIAAGWLYIRDLVQRPGAAAGHRQEFRPRAERQCFVEGPADFARAHARPLARHIEQGAAADVEALGDPKIGEGLKGGPADQGCDDAFVADDDRKSAGG